MQEIISLAEIQQMKMVWKTWFILMQSANLGNYYKTIR